jgi:calcium-dependent protein kinase
MKNFRSKGRFKKEVLKILVNMMDDKELKELRNMFRKLDVNNTN